MTSGDFIHQFQDASNGTALTLLLLHGTGGDEHDLLELGSRLAPGAALLSPRGKVLEHGNARFFRRFAEGQFDIEDLIFRTHELADFIEAASAEYQFSLDSLVAVGYSNGANIAASLLLLRPTVLAGAVLFRAMLPLEVEDTPDLNGKQVLIAAGESDPLMPQNFVEALASVLQSSGADVTLLWQSAGHQLVQDDIQAASDWIQENYYQHG